MMIEAVSLATMRTELRTPWPTSEGPVSVRESAFLLLHSGTVGGLARAAVGESAPLPGFGLESFASSVAALRVVAKKLIALTENDLSGAIRDLRNLAPVAAAPAARHAIDLALHDFLGICWGVSIRFTNAIIPAKASWTPALPVMNWRRACRCRPAMRSIFPKRRTSRGRCMASATRRLIHTGSAA